ncbi:MULTISPECIES: DNA-processing protein DprA [unclassified Bosea (in: a-proteobacteria)]|uniref:DNA-processing protein DprA n=1 Tax=unclassified Bosea (in: a-proteobacteria) TaxID=2653178 RepID=UPI000F750F8A|nr:MULTISPECIES: DNA-processing protein DprA [unclassified Bosea (in: a-proteobacteria)]AZO77341.1 DNA protecting protein DprA [Bosea sp. Tri-49]RXT22200.1 DNA protecting protein DprA [Bosea sp. Tri-39]RXT32542.1 DNA protecting protein DprA [Bosea sp. Tri-54]
MPMAGFALDDRQRLDWLRLIRSESIGPRTFRTLVNRFGGAAGALDALPELGRQAGRTLRLCTAIEAERELEALRRRGTHLIALGEATYPVPLQAIDSAPPLIAIEGDPAVLNRPCVALVGSRNASAAGLKFTATLARELGEAGFVVVSGLARGIDTTAHQASLENGTIAVLAGGLDEVYPPQNIPLIDRIRERGAALSEMPIGWAPRGRDFPRRNRLVSGLALGTVVVEAARKSGSLITARFANEQGRQVFAVPGSPLDPRAEGGNHLIREGAILCAETAHVVDALTPMLRRGDLFDPAPFLAREEGEPRGRQEALWDELELPDVLPAPTAELNGDELGTRPTAQAGDTSHRRLLDLIGSTPVAMDDLVRASGRPAREVSRILLELELEGVVQRHVGGALSRLA